MLKYLVVLLAACTTFDPVDRGVCGNGLVEPGEDCDSDDATCIACAVVCTKAADCPNAAFTCGTDDRCHAPGGALGQGQVAGLFAANDYRITDLDHDGFGDVLGVSDSSIVIRHGAASGLLSTLDSSLTPTQTAPASFGNLDGDASIDLALATPDGIVAFTSPYGTLSPLDVDNLITDPTASQALDIFSVFTVTHEAIGGLVVDNSGGPANGKLGYVIFDFIDIDHPVNGAPCNQLIDQSELDPANIDVYQLNDDGSSPTDVVVSLVWGSGPAKKLCVLAVHKSDLFATPTVTDITPQGAPTYAQKPLLIDMSVDADRCPSIVDVDAGPAALKRYDGVMTGGHCTLKQTLVTTPAMPVTTPQTTIVGRAPANPGVIGTSSDLIVASDGIYVFGGTAWVAVYPSARPWGHVAYADLDKDGQTDLVMSGAGADDLDILYRASILGYPTFQLFRIDTAAEVTAITIDDFDGNGWRDIAFVQKLANHDELDVVYNTADRPLPPVRQGVFGGLVGFAKIGFQDSADPLNQISDLLVLTKGAPYNGLTFLHGSANRSLLPYFDPRTNTAATRYAQNTVFRGTAIGAFVPTIGGGADHPDLVAIATPKSAMTDAGTSARMWIASGNGATLDGAESDGAALSGLAACGLGTATAGCAEQAMYLPWHVRDGHDVVLALDRGTAPVASIFDPTSQIATMVTATQASDFSAPPATTIRSLHSADLDGDGTSDLVAAFQPVGDGPGGVLVCAMDARGPHDCSDATAAITALDATARCFDAAPARISGRDRFSTAAAPMDLVVACHDTGTTLYRVHGDTADVLVHTASILTSIQIGDVTGDGVDDVVAQEGASGAEALVVFRQCTSRDAASCTQGAGL